MRGQEIREEALNWWRESLHNLRQAKKNIEIDEYSVAAFLCHQAAEKALKSIIHSDEKPTSTKGS